MYKNSKWSGFSQAAKRSDDAKRSALTIFYDGQCLVCAKEMEHYRRLDRLGRLRWIDISDAAFDPAPYGVGVGQLMAAMHARSADGCWYVGVAAFEAIWQRLPGRLYRFLAWSATCRLWRPMLDLGYRLFARYRHLLPRSGAACPDGSCAVMRPKKTKGG